MTTGPADVPTVLLEDAYDAAVDRAEEAEGAVRRVRELYVGLDGVADSNTLLASRRVRGLQADVESVLGSLKQERDHWQERRDALRDRMEAEGLLDD